MLRSLLGWAVEFENDDEPRGMLQAAAYGFFIMLAPLSRGDHEIHFAGAAVFTVANDGFDFEFRLDITYHISVDLGSNPRRDATRLLHRRGTTTLNPAE